MDTLPTIVLLHGAHEDSSCWNTVLTELQNKSYSTIAVANPLRGGQPDAEALSTVLDSMGGPIVLVGHSYGGVAITRAASRTDNVAALVYVSALAPDNGESACDLLAKFPGSTLSDSLIDRAYPDGHVDLYVDPLKFHQELAADVSVGDSTLMAATQRPVAATAFAQNFPGDVVPAWKTVPSWFVFGDLDRAIPVAMHRYLAGRAGALGTVEIAGAPHAIMAVHGRRVAEVIDLAAQATVGDWTYSECAPRLHLVAQAS